jgi:hypothetical protein
MNIGSAAVTSPSAAYTRKKASVRDGLVPNVALRPPAALNSPPVS